jgi:hypothetical protein
MQAFGVVNIVGLNLNLTKVGDLAIQVTHNGMYTRVRVWLKIGDGARNWRIIACHQHKYYFSTIFVQSFEY